MKIKQMKNAFIIALFFVFFYNVPAFAATFSANASCEMTKSAKIIVNTNEYDFDGFEISRSENKNGEFSFIYDMYLSDYYNCDYEEAAEYNMKYYYIDNANLSVYKTYYYEVKPYNMVNGKKIYSDAQVISVMVLPAGPSITYGKRSGKLGAKLKWTKDASAEGYCIFYLKDYDDDNNFIYVDANDYSSYQLAKTITNRNTLSTTIKKLKNGVTYTYYICSYKTIDGSRVFSTPSNIKAITMDYYAYANESYTKKVKRAFGSTRKQKKNFKSASKARKQMKTIKIKVWDYKKGKKGKKITKTKTLVVNKGLAPTVKQIFAEIYKSKEKQVIHEIGCYSYRQGEHMYGLAIDVNWTENYMIDGKKVLCGKYWKPKKDPYSIPNNSEFVRIMNRYGFTRGEWGKRKDYMHFSYFGT